MRLEKHDVEILLPACLTMLSKKGNLNVKDFQYELAQDLLSLNVQAIYMGLPIHLDLTLSCFVKGGAVGIRIEKGYLDSVFMKGDVLPFLKTLIKNHPHLCLEDRILYFYDPKILVQRFEINQVGIELVFK